jgi:hypothetical protein
MLCDYRPNKKPKSGKEIHKKKINLSHKLVFSIILVLLIVILSALAIKIELNNLYRLKENERVLLIKNQRPVAILFFNVNNKQLVVTDLRRSNFDLSGLEKEATISGNLKKNLIYNFLFNTAFDQSYEYSYEDLSRESLLAFFKNQKIYSFFLKDRELLWKEQKFKQEGSSIVEPTFNCPIVLINTTIETGLASSLASILEKSSLSIIKKDSNVDNLTQTKIIYDPDEKSCGQILGRLNKILPNSLVIADEKEALNHRAALVIYIGRDLADLYVFFINLFHSQI